MGQLRNRLRRFVDADGPLAPGLLVIGDAAYHSNPIYGRGCSQALVQAALLDEAVGRHPRDPEAAARLLHLPERGSRSARSGMPPWPPIVARAANGAVPRPGNALAYSASWPSRPSAGSSSAACCPATRVDPVVFRGLLRVFHMLDAARHARPRPRARAALAAHAGPRARRPRSGAAVRSRSPRSGAGADGVVSRTCSAGTSRRPPPAPRTAA